ncbi:LacI family DNA-binding transcriptional regulator [Candidatus Poriferisocius sp.]|uniref:LacI family DNA-binding transcriptional regulator n=1 Tax=Candidatus Poriferisocius sp. TaxID=3101276 RepID=UPI003B010FE8
MGAKPGEASSAEVRNQQQANRRVTSVDVAAESGVSQATVARVFSSPEKVSPATREKVRSAAERLGYVPNAIARSLKSQRTNIVGAVVPAYGEYWQNVLAEFSRQLAQRSYQLLLFSFAKPEDVDGALASVAQYRLDGVILASATIGQAQLGRMQSSPLPSVAFNQPAAEGLVPSVSVDNEVGMAELAQHLVDMKVGTALYIGGVSSVSTDQVRYRGAVQALAEHGVACPYMEAGAYTYDAGYKAAGELAQRDNLPEAVMVGSDEVAFGVLDGLENAGISAPRDLLLTGFDGLPQASWAGYDLTTLVQATDVLVAQAIDVLLDSNSAADRPASVVVPGTIRYGMTTKKSDG